MKTRQFWLFNLAFWLMCALLVVLNALYIDHWKQVAARFVYLPMLGVMLSTFLALLFESRWFRSLERPQLVVVGASVLAAFIALSILNPLTYLLLDIEFAGRMLEILTRGIVMHSVIFLLWSLLYFQADGRSLFRVRDTGHGDYIARIGVDHRGRVRAIPVDQIEHISAAGDYVEIHLEDQSYLKKETISGLESLLNPVRFRRVHRSAIVNVSKVARIVSKGSGAYTLTMKSGSEVPASRSYRSVVMALKAPTIAA